MQGWRPSMEDTYAAVLNRTAKDAKPSSNTVALFGVFDGHGGDKIASYTAKNLFRILTERRNFKSGDYTNALKDGFLEIDRTIRNGMFIRLPHGIPSVVNQRAMSRWIRR